MKRSIASLRHPLSTALLLTDTLLLRSVPKWNESKSGLLKKEIKMIKCGKENYLTSPSIQLTQSVVLDGASKDVQSPSFTLLLLLLLQLVSLPIWKF